MVNKQPLSLLFFVFCYKDSNMLFYVFSSFFLEGVQKDQCAIRRKIGAKNIIFYWLYTRQQHWKMNCKHILFIPLLIFIFALYIQWVLARVMAYYCNIGPIFVHRKCYTCQSGIHTIIVVVLGNWVYYFVLY